MRLGVSTEAFLQKSNFRVVAVFVSGALKCLDWFSSVGC